MWELETTTSEDIYFPRWDISMFAITLYETARSLKEVIEKMKTSNDLFDNKSESIANAMLALRSMEEAEFRMYKSMQNILDK